MVNMKVAEGVAMAYMKFTVDKDWEPDSIWRLKFLPKLCYLRKPELVGEWLENYFKEFQAKSAAAIRSTGKHNTRANPTEAKNESGSESESTSLESADEYELNLVSADVPSTSKQTFPVSSKVTKRKALSSTDDDLSEDDGKQHEPLKKKRKMPTTTQTSEKKNNNLQAVTFQLMSDRTRKVEEELEKMKKEAKLRDRRIKDMEAALGHLLDASKSADDSGIVKAAYIASTDGRQSADSKKSKVSSADRAEAEKSYNTHYSSYPVGTVPWIKQTYGMRAHQLMVKLTDLGIGESKWPLIFDARYSADKLLPQRILEARFNEQELAKFVMVRPNATIPKDAHGQPLKGLDGTVLAPVKTVLPMQKEMIEVISTLALGPFTPAHASRRWTSMLTHAGRRKHPELEVVKLPPVAVVLPDKTSKPVTSKSKEILPLATSTQIPLTTPSQEDFDSQETQLVIDEINLVVEEDEEDQDKTQEFVLYDAFKKPLSPKKK